MIKKYAISQIKSLLIIFLLLFFTWKMGEGIASGKLKHVYLPIGIAVSISLPYFARRLGSFPFLLGLIFIFWVPVSAGLGNISQYLDMMWPAEFGMWILLAVILIHGSVTKNAYFDHTVYVFPFIPLLLIITGFLLANLTSGHFFRGYEIPSFRVGFILPFIALFLFLYFMNSLHKTNRAIWAFLISSGLFVAIYLFAPTVAPVEYFEQQGSERLYKLIMLPLCERIYITPANGAICISSVLSVSYLLFIKFKTIFKKLVALTVLGMCISSLILSQGRSAIIGVTCAVLAIEFFYAVFYRKTGLSLKVFLKPFLIGCIILVAVFIKASTSTDTYYREHGLQLFQNPINLVKDSGRLGRWTDAVHVIKKNPLGVGIWGYPSTNNQSWVAHNLYLYLWLSFGFVGLIGFLLLLAHLIKLFYAGLHSLNRDKVMFSILGLGCVVIIMVSGMSSPIFWSPWEVLIFWFPISISAAAVSIPVSSPKNV
jgi:O-antigen ligase